MKCVMILFLLILPGCYAYDDAINMAEENPGKEICFKLSRYDGPTKHYCIVQK